MTAFQADDESSILSRGSKFLASSTVERPPCKRGVLSSNLRRGSYFRPIPAGQPSTAQRRCEKRGHPGSPDHAGFLHSSVQEERSPSAQDKREHERPQLKDSPGLNPGCAATFQQTRRASQRCVIRRVFLSSKAIFTSTAAHLGRKARISRALRRRAFTSPRRSSAVSRLAMFRRQAIRPSLASCG